MYVWGTTATPTTGVIINPVWTYTKKWYGYFKAWQTDDGGQLNVKGLQRNFEHSKWLDGEETCFSATISAL